MGRIEVEDDGYTKNFRGLNAFEKRMQIMKELLRMKATVAFLQETHQTKEKIINLNNWNFPHVYNGYSLNCKSSGV